MRHAQTGWPQLYNFPSKLWLPNFYNPLISSTQYQVYDLSQEKIIYSDTNYTKQKSNKVKRETISA